MTLRLYFDEDVSVPLAGILSTEGVDVLTALAAGRAHQRISDSEQLEFAAGSGRAICTLNARDYAPLAVEWAQAGRAHAGIILIRGRPLAELAARFRALIARYPDGMANVCDWL